MTTMVDTDIVGGLLVRGDGRLLLGRRSAHKRIAPGTWDLIGGHVEAGESERQTLDRELLEEIGVVPVAVRALTRFVFDTGARFTVFRVDAWSGEPTLCNAEHDALAWWTVEEACALPDLAAPEYVALFRGFG